MYIDKRLNVLECELLVCTVRVVSASAVSPLFCSLLIVEINF